MMILVESGEQRVYLVDRKFKFSIVKKRFPDTLNLPHNLDQTLLDGEMVFDREGTKTITRFLLFDIIFIRGKNVMNEILDRRLGFLMEHIVKPAGSVARSDDDFELRMKDFKKVKHVDYLLNEVIDKGLLPHKNDGLIFTPVRHPYEVGTCHKLLKWKPDSLNTIDFEIHPGCRTVGNQYEICICERGKPKPCDYMVLDEEDKAVIFPILQQNRHAVLECYFDKERLCGTRVGSWKFMRIRNDKDRANDISVLRKTLAMIHTPVTKEELIAESKIPARANTSEAPSHPQRSGHHDTQHQAQISGRPPPPSSSAPPSQVLLRGQQDHPQRLHNTGPTTSPFDRKRRFGE
eukprot:TRINITY_DN5407_c0_g1_i5.p1 TRINITY_DN5407_c0_g1~~TRINITY_DN5407_c0_g1_i5.p1  ORF type:complete len:348 (+),score=56.47 TRINITY_DN5407_c0_g1_i5:242-1285(+)